jgi:hypothetical protein
VATKRTKVLSTIKTIILEETHNLLEGPYPPPFEDLQDNRGDKHAEELAAAYRRYKNELKNALVMIRTLIQETLTSLR